MSSTEKSIGCAINRNGLHTNDTVRRQDGWRLENIKSHISGGSRPPNNRFWWEEGFNASSMASTTIV